ncbi:hypothetical protein HDV05_004093 [Chytridiales sp. JEL 0842]|nr:hypothetical protein HDV05_004093 [Chytridiales sp. JEL 0842]
MNTTSTPGVITRDDILQHIKELGFGDDSFPESFIHECIREFNEKYAAAAAAAASSVREDPVPLETTTPRETPRRETSTEPSSSINEWINNTTHFTHEEEDSNTQSYLQFNSNHPSTHSSGIYFKKEYPSLTDNDDDDDNYLDVSEYDEIWKFEGRPALRQENKPTDSFQKPTTAAHSSYADADEDDILLNISAIPKLHKLPDPYELTNSHSFTGDIPSASASYSEQKTTTTPQTTRNDSNAEDNLLNSRLANLDLSSVRKRIEMQKKQTIPEQKKAGRVPLSKVIEKMLEDVENFKGLSEDDEEEEETASVTSSIASSYALSQRSSSSKPRAHSGYIKPCIPAPPVKKHDPVKRFHRHQQQWSKDSFLTRQKDSKRVPLVPKTNTGEVALAFPVRPRHNLALMRPTYVVPTEKLRRDVVWDVRNRMSQRLYS